MTPGGVYVITSPDERLQFINAALNEGGIFATITLKENETALLIPSYSFPDTNDVPLAVVIEGLITIEVPEIITNEINGAINEIVIGSFSASVIAGKGQFKENPAAIVCTVG